MQASVSVKLPRKKVYQSFGRITLKLKYRQELKSISDFLYFYQEIIVKSLRRINLKSIKS